MVRGRAGWCTQEPSTRMHESCGRNAREGKLCLVEPDAHSRVRWKFARREVRANPIVVHHLPATQAQTNRVDEAAMLRSRARDCNRFLENNVVHEALGAREHGPRITYSGDAGAVGRVAAQEVRVRCANAKAGFSDPERQASRPRRTQSPETTTSLTTSAVCRPRRRMGSLPPLYGPLSSTWMSGATPLSSSSFVYSRSVATGNMR